MQKFTPIDPQSEIKRLKARIQELELKLKEAEAKIKETEDKRDKFKRKLRRAQKGS